MICNCSTVNSPRRARLGADWCDFTRCPVCGCVEILEAQIDGVIHEGEQAREAWKQLTAVSNERTETAA